MDEEISLTPAGYCSCCKRPMREVPPAHVYVVGEAEGPVKVGYTSGKLSVRLYQLSRDAGKPLTLLASWPVHQYVADVAERYAHHLLRDKHMHGEWFNAAVQEAAAVIPRAIEAAESGFALMPSLFRTGQRQKDGEKVHNLKLPLGSHHRIEAVLMDGEVRSDFLRVAVERELQRREQP